MSENNKIVIKNVFGAFVVKGLSLILSLFTMPAYLRFFNNEVALGLWFTILSVLTWILNFDLGIGNGLRNHLARTLTNKDYDEAKKYMSSAYISIAGICVIVSAIFLLVFDFVDWNKVFNIEVNVVSSEALLLTVKIVFLGIILQFFSRLISSVLYAMQKSSINNFMGLCTSILIVLSVVIMPSSTNDKNMVAMAIAHTVAVILPSVVASIIIFAQKNMRKIIPSFKAFTKSHSKQVLSLGGIFFFAQITYMVIMSTNEYLITLFAGSEYVVEYQIYYKWFTLGGTVFSLAMTPVWSAVTKAITEKNFSWLRSLYKKLMILSGIATVCEFLIIPFLQILINIWLGDEAIPVNYWHAVSFAILGSLMIFNGALSSIANGMGELKTQVIFFGIGAVAKVPIGWLLVQAFGWNGVVWSNIIAMALYLIVQPFYLNRFLKKKELKAQQTSAQVCE